MCRQAQFLKVASSKNTQALSRALVRVRASVSNRASHLQAPIVSDTVKDGSCFCRTGLLPSCDVGASNSFSPETPVHGSRMEMHLSTHSWTDGPCGLIISCPQGAQSFQPNGLIQEARTLTYRRLKTLTQAQQPACPPSNKDASDILTDSYPESLKRHMGILGVSKTVRTHFSTRNTRRCDTLCARNFHSGRALQQQYPAFATEQEEERFNASTTSSSTGSTANSGLTGDEGLEIAKLPISRILVDSLARRGITKLFPIQKAVLEPGMKGQDLIARAKTGTGKTLAFGIPILDRIIKENETMNRRYGKAPLAVVMAPTRELAKQVETELKDSAPNLELVCVYGGVSIEAQVRQLQRGVDIAVGTPGRFIDLLERGDLNLREVKYIVLDEADRMLAVGFVEAVQKIFSYLPPIRQSMLFSATMPAWVQDLSRRYLKNPLVVDLVGNNEEKIAEGIKLLSLSTPLAGKLSILSDLIKVYGKGCKSIVFTQTKRDADDVAMSLSKSLACEPLHGDITQFQRERTLKAFRDGKISVLIATDVAARGLDIPNVDLVVHYEIANDSETFVHRSGRTGRAGKEGTAILMHTPYQRRTLDTLERELACRFQSIEPPTAVDVVKSSTEMAAAKLRSVQPEVRNIFLPTAEKLFSEEGLGGFAAAIAHLCGYSEEMASRSLLTHETGLTTVKITRTNGQPIFSATDVMRAISQLLPSAVNNIGKICMLSGEAGAVVDLPAKCAKELLSLNIETGEVIEALTQIPNIVEEPFGNQRFGGRPPFQRGPPGGRPGGFSGGRLGGFSNRPADSGNWSNRSPGNSGGDWSSRPSGGSWGNRPPSSYGGGSSSYGGGGSSYGGGTSSYGGAGSSYGGAYSSSRSPAASTNSSGDWAGRPFSGQCLKCGQTGHRAIECPR